MNRNGCKKIVRFLKIYLRLDYHLITASHETKSSDRQRELVSAVASPNLSIYSLTTQVHQ